MKLTEIINTYGGRSDYMDMNTGVIYCFSNAIFDKDTNKTIIPVKDPYGSGEINFTEIKGKIEDYV